MKIKAGDKVQFTDSFCQSIQADSETANLIGIVQSVKDYPQIKKTVVKVLWGNDIETSSSFAQFLKIVK